MKDMTGLRFGRLVVMRHADNSQRGSARWLCVCDCSTQKVVCGTHLRHGLVRSCGCLRRETSAERMRHLGARSGPECVNYRPRGDRLRVFEDLFGVNGDDDDADRDDDADADDVEKSVDHAASTVADLLVESGRFPHSGAALDHLLNSRHGNALLGRLHKAAKGETMRGDNLESILKDCGPVRLCKGIVERQRSPCTEAELVAVLTKHAGGDRAFAKLCETEPNVLRACSIAKAAEFAAFDDTPMVVGGADARDVDNATAAVRAYEEIVRIGREKFPFLRADSNSRA